MSSAILRYDALKKLACAIEANVPALVGKICVGQGRPGHKLGFPSLAILPTSFTFEPLQEYAVFRNTRESVTYCVGHWRGVVQLRITTATLAERYAIEEAVSQVFMQRAGAPGVLVVDVLAGADDVMACAFEFDGADWVEAFGLDQAYGATIALDAIVPALTCRSPEYAIRQIRLGMSGEMQDSITIEDIDDGSTVEVVDVEQE